MNNTLEAPSPGQPTTSVSTTRKAWPTPITTWPAESWFENAMGFREDEDYATTQQKLMVLHQQSNKGDNNSNGCALKFGSFSCPTVKELRDDCQIIIQELSSDEMKSSTLPPPGPAVWSNVQRACVLTLHMDSSNTDATFQAASQFNCLEFVSPSCTPEQGITNYRFDRTQGPACAMACGAGTAYRNYLVEWDNNKNTGGIATQHVEVGQTAKRQINNLDLVLDKLQICGIQVVNGYAKGDEKSLNEAAVKLQVNPDEWIDCIKVGVQQDTEVTYPQTTGRTVTQVYCSAVPISYSDAGEDAWKSLAQVALAGAYEATLLVAIRNVVQALLDGDLEKAARCQRVYLTLVGGGVFGNRIEWIHEAIRRANRRVSMLSIPLSVTLVHFGQVDMDSRKLVEELSSIHRR